MKVCSTGTEGRDVVLKQEFWEIFNHFLLSKFAEISNFIIYVFDLCFCRLPSIQYWVRLKKNNIQKKQLAKKTTYKINNIQKKQHTKKQHTKKTTHKKTTYKKPTYKTTYKKKQHTRKTYCKKMRSLKLNEALHIQKSTGVVMQQNIPRRRSKLTLLIWISGHRLGQSLRGGDRGAPV